jgi:signal transduction histidine kinase
MASNNAQTASTAASELQRLVNERFGVLPNFFRLSPETPEITKIARDITERKRVERELLESEQRFANSLMRSIRKCNFRSQELRRRNADILQQSDQLRDLSGRLMLAQDEERRRIARELHDSAGQNLAALGMILAPLEHEAKRDPARFSKSINEAQDLVQNLNQEIRTTSYLLHPPMLDESGLSSALRWYTEGLGNAAALVST